VIIMQLRIKYLLKMTEVAAYEYLASLRYIMSTAEWEELCDEYAQSLAERN